MRTATHDPTTPASPPVSAPKRIRALDPNLLPDEYALVVEGQCMMPEIADGQCLLFDKRQPFGAGDLVVLWHRPELVRPGGHQAIVKRLVTNLPRGLRLPYREHPNSEVQVVIVTEQINPRRQAAIPCAGLLAIHRCLGPVPADVVRVKVTDEDILAMHRLKLNVARKAPALAGEEARHG